MDKFVLWDDIYKNEESSIQKHGWTTVRGIEINIRGKR